MFDKKSRPILAKMAQELLKMLASSCQEWSKVRAPNICPKTIHSLPLKGAPNVKIAKSGHTVLPHRLHLYAQQIHVIRVIRFLIIKVGQLFQNMTQGWEILSALKAMPVSFKSP